MKANEKSLIRFLEVPNINFVIPVYQRNYDWKKEQCEKLFDDLVSVVKNNSANHFFGTVVSIYNIDGDGREYLIIDGQQRTTTITLLLLAIYNILKEEKIVSGVNKDMIFNQYLYNQYLNGEAKYKLRLIKEDNIALKKIIDQEDLIEDSNITLNYNYFCERILSEEISVDDLYKAIEKLIIVEIELKNGEDDPQLIFESLNSTGLDLSDADKVRNFILMGQALSVQERLYNEFWCKIEKNTAYNVSMFLRDYLTIKEGKIPTMNKVYTSFKSYVITNNINIEECLSDILKFSKYYKMIITNSMPSNNASEIIKRINQLEIGVVNPFLMGLIEDYESNIIGIDELTEALSILESYIFRRFVCKLPTNALNKIFMSLQKEIRKFADYKEKYIEILKHILITKRGTQRYPYKEEFKEAFINSDFYNIKGKNRLYLLERLENYNNVERVDIDNLLANKLLSIEHIMPQTLTQSWKENLGSRYEEVHLKYLNTIGNLTLTGYNSSYSNKTFLEKRNAENGFKQSRLKLNAFADEITKWGEEEIRQRANSLYEIAEKIWSYPETTYNFNKGNIYSLADEFGFTGTKIVKYTFKETTVRVKSWADFYKSLIRKLYESDKTGLELFIKKEKLKDRIPRVSDSKDGLRVVYELDENIFMEMNVSAQGRIDIIKLILDEYKINYADVIFEIE